VRVRHSNARAVGGIASYAEVFDADRAEEIDESVVRGAEVRVGPIVFRQYVGSFEAEAEEIRGIAMPEALRSTVTVNCDAGLLVVWAVSVIGNATRRMSAMSAPERFDFTELLPTRKMCAGNEKTGPSALFAVPQNCVNGW